MRTEAAMVYFKVLYQNLTEETGEIHCVSNSFGSSSSGLQSKSTDRCTTWHTDRKLVSLWNVRHTVLVCTNPCYVESTIGTSSDIRLE